MHYRDEMDAMRARRDAIEGELVETDRSEGRWRELEGELEAVRESLEEADRELALRVLGSVRIATPCPASWDAMTGDDRVRHCALCEKNVYDLSALTAIEAVRLLAEHGERACVRLHRRRDGTVITSDCEVGVRRRRRRLAFAAGALVTASAVASALAPASSTVASERVVDEGEAFELDERAYLRDPMSLQGEERVRDHLAWQCAIGACPIPVDALPPELLGAPENVETATPEPLNDPTHPDSQSHRARTRR